MTTADSATLSCPLFAMAPELLVDATADRKGTLFVYLNLWRHGNGSLGIRKNSYPSVETQASQCRMDPKDVREARNWLIENGWLLREERPGSTPNFTILLEPRTPPRKRPTPGAKAPRGRCPRTPLGQKPHPTPGAYAPPNKNHLTRAIEQEVLEPPLPPTARGERRPEAVAAPACRDQDGFLLTDPEPHAAEPAAVQPQPQLRPQPQNPPRPLPAPPDPEAVPPVKPKAQKREAGFVPANEDVPAALLPVVRELLAFWPARNPKAKRTQQAWRGMLTEAQKIQDHQQGGTEILRDQLVEGAEARVRGPGWLGLNFNRWQQYGTKAGAPMGGPGRYGKRTTMDRVQGAIALIEQRERAAAARAQQAGQGALVLAEVA